MGELSIDAVPAGNNRGMRGFWVQFGSPWWVGIFGVLFAFTSVGIARVVRAVQERRIVRESRRRRASSASPGDLSGE